MKLYIVHCGYADRSIANAVYESHTNFFIVAESFADAKRLAKAKPDFKRLKMHVDSLQEIEVVDGFRIALNRDDTLDNQTKINYKNPWARTDE